MRNERNIPEKTQRLSDTYLIINDEGRNLLDMFIQELQETHGEPEEINRTKQPAYVKPLGGINEK